MASGQAAPRLPAEVAWLAELRALRDAVQGEGLDPPPGGSGWLDSRLVATYCPTRFTAPEEEEEGPDDTGFWRLCPRGLAACGEADEEAEEDGFPGLVSCPKFETARGPYGLNGLTRNGRREVLRSGSVLKEFHRQLGFWTVTLPPEAEGPILDQGLWPKFQDRIRKELARLLKRAGLTPLVVGVAEIHPKRSAEAGRPIPHLHVVFRGKKNRWHHWALEKWQLDGIIASALGSCGVHGISVKAAGNLQGVRSSAAGYLAKYMSKDVMKQPDSQKPGWHLPALDKAWPVRQWWFRTRELLALVRETTYQLPRSFLAMIHRDREQLGEEGLIRWWSYDLEDVRAPACYGVRFASAAAMAEVLARWHEWLEDRRLFREVLPMQQWPHSI